MNIKKTIYRGSCRGFLIVLIFMSFGCSGSKVISTSATAAKLTPIKNLLVIEGFQSYDIKYADNISPKFDEYFSKELTQRGVVNLVVPLIAEFEPKKIETQKTLKALGFENAMTLRFYQYTPMGGDIEARLWINDGTQEAWVGRYRWEKKGTLFENQQDRSLSIANLVIEGLIKDGLVQDTKIPIPTEMAVNAAKLKEKIVRVPLTQNSNADKAVSSSTNLYIQKLRSKIRGNVILPPGVDGGGGASGVYRIKQTSSGDVLEVKTVKSSGNNRLDAAVNAAIWKSSPLPIPEGRKPDSQLDITYVP